MPDAELTLPPDAIQRAAQILAARRRSGQVGGALPPACRPASLSDALAVQEAVTHILSQGVGDHQSDPVVGWKCGLPGADTWVLAPLYASVLYRVDDGHYGHDGQALPSLGWPVWTQAGRVKVEPELAFVLGRDLPARAQAYGADEVLAAVTRIHLALELIDNRYDEQEKEPLHFADRLADGLVNQGLWLGPAIDLARGCASQVLDVEVRAAGQSLVSQRGSHPAVDPSAPLCWLAEFLRARGQGLRAGQVVITGSYAGSPWVPVDTALQVQFGDLGTVSLQFQTRLRT